MGYAVKVPLIQARKVDGSFVHVYEGGLLPDDQDPDQLSQLVESGMVEEADAPSDDEDDKPSRARRGKSAD